MWEVYVSFETAELLKEKGFDGECDFLYVNGNIVRAQGCGYNWNKGETIFTDYKNECSAPTLQMTMKWLREVHNIFISIVFCTYPTEKRVTWTPEISTFDSVFPESAIEYDSYEQACEAAVKYCLENLV